MAATTFNVPDTYKHYPKRITPNDDLLLGGARLKWYDIHRAESRISDAVQKEARDFLRNDSDLAIDGDLGFVILHRCGDSFFFLIVCTWRNANELWETTYAKDGDAPFALFPKERHKPVFCVWELGAVIHEQQAWTNYLYSARDDEARRAWMADRFRGEV
ncbi:MAG TPA: hypothetical protein VGQ65_22230 [Thermoanaerobaculia bacterium]|jgi:hypothetical protein|nr:hypothetical protein [Thermoanaerobaculia bacterium]